MEGFAFDCPSCGMLHNGLPAVVFDGPAVGLGPDGQPWPLNRNGEDFCVVNEQDFFVRAVLSIPILGTSETMEWGVWSSLSEANFKRYWDTFYDTDQAKLGPMFSFLGNQIVGYPNTLCLRSRLHPQNERKRPFVEFDPSQDHPLIHDQLHGITVGRAIELVMPVLHPEGNA